MKKKYITASCLYVAMLLLDIFSKRTIVSTIGFTERHNIIGEFVQFVLVYNQGGIFGIMQGKMHFFLIASIIVLALLIALFISEKNKSWLFTISMSLIFCGACGNIIDRFIYPGVVDFIYVGWETATKSYRWPAFNVADSCVVVGTILLLIFFLRTEKKQKKATK